MCREKYTRQAPLLRKRFQITVRRCTKQYCLVNLIGASLGDKAPISLSPTNISLSIIGMRLFFLLHGVCLASKFYPRVDYSTVAAY